jgi:DNA-binding ferritin-like protein
MIPVLISLIHSVLETANVREEIDQGIKDARDIARDAREAIKNENERWDKERQDMEDVSKNNVDKNKVTHLFCILQHLLFMVIENIG